jgi:hypothetical protein
MIKSLCRGWFSIRNQAWALIADLVRLAFEFSSALLFLHFQDFVLEFVDVASASAEL